MALWSIVSRVSDGLPLCESTDPIPVTGAETQKTQAKLILKRLDSRSPARLSVESGTFLYSYAVDDGIVVLVITDARYPKRLIFGFLRDAHAEFSSYVREAHGESWRSVISATGQAYAFLGFAKILSRLRRDYADTDSKANANRLAGELFDVQSIMRQNIAEVLDRGERLDREWGSTHQPNVLKRTPGLPTRPLPQTRARTHDGDFRRVKGFESTRHGK
jgi:vesicle transport protein SEC22